MPTGKMFMHPQIGTLFICGEDGRYYQPKPEVKLEPDTAVTFDVRNEPGAPPGFYFAGNVQKVVTAPKAMGAWAKPPTLTPSKVITPSQPKVDAPNPVQVAPTKPVSPALPLPNTNTPRTLTDRTTREDFEAIVRQVDGMDWGRNKGFGPSLSVTTRLKWEGEGKELYLRVLEEYQDQKIPGTSFWYFVGTMGLNFGKGGFRISAHSQPKANIGKSTTYTVLHIEN